MLSARVQHFRLRFVERFTAVQQFVGITNRRQRSRLKRDASALRILNGVAWLPCAITYGEGHPAPRRAAADHHICAPIMQGDELPSYRR